MITPSVALALLLLGVTTLWIIAGVVAVARVRRRASPRRSSPAQAPPITVLKPLAGVDPGLEANLASFFTQRYPVFQLLFGVERADDPAVPVVERLRARYPGVDARLVVSSRFAGVNPKVSNLRAMLPHARYDLVLISDSNVRAPSDYLDDLAATYLSGAEEGAPAGRTAPIGLVTNVFSGLGERDLGAALENVQLNGFIAAGALVPTRAGDAAVVGKSMFFSRAVFERLGGFEVVSGVLAEDFIIGKMFQHGGYRVVVARTVLASVNGEVPLARFFDRQLRWAMMRLRLRPLAFVLEPLSSPLLMAVIAVKVLGPAAGISWALLLMLLRDAGQWVLLRGARRSYLPVALGLLREAAQLVTWCVVPFVRHVSWRGHRVRLGAGTHVFVPDSAR